MNVNVNFNIDLRALDCLKVCVHNLEVHHTTNVVVYVQILFLKTTDLLFFNKGMNVLFTY